MGWSVGGGEVGCEGQDEGKNKKREGLQGGQHVEVNGGYGQRNVDEE